jgi:hypothetical protein
MTRKAQRGGRAKPPLDPKAKQRVERAERKTRDRRSVLRDAETK